MKKNNDFLTFSPWGQGVMGTLAKFWSFLRKIGGKHVFWWFISQFFRPESGRSRNKMSDTQNTQNHYQKKIYLAFWKKLTTKFKKIDPSPFWAKKRGGGWCFWNKTLFFDSYLALTKKKEVGQKNNIFVVFPEFSCRRLSIFSCLFLILTS